MRAGDDARFAEIAANQLGIVGADAPARELWMRLGAAAIERHGGDDSLRAKLLTNYGNALRNDDRLDEAEAAHREALELRRRDPDAPTLVADALNLTFVGDGYCLDASERYYDFVRRNNVTDSSITEQVSNTEWVCYDYNYNAWPYGLEVHSDPNVPSMYSLPYLHQSGGGGGGGTSLAPERYRQRNVTYLIGQNDTWYV